MWERRDLKREATHLQILFTVVATDDDSRICLLLFFKVFFCSHLPLFFTSISFFLWILHKPYHQGFEGKKTKKKKKAPLPHTTPRPSIHSIHTTTTLTHTIFFQENTK